MYFINMLVWVWFRWFWLSPMTPRSPVTETTLSTPWGCGQPRPPVTSTSKTVSIVICTVKSSSCYWTQSSAWSWVTAVVPQLMLVATSRLCWTETWLRTSPGFSTPTTTWVDLLLCIYQPPTSVCISSFSNLGSYFYSFGQHLR